MCTLLVAYFIRSVPLSMAVDRRHKIYSSNITFRRRSSQPGIEQHRSLLALKIECDFSRAKLARLKGRSREVKGMEKPNFQTCFP